MTVTRYYLPSSGTAPLTESIPRGSGWTTSTGTSLWQLTTTPGTTGITQTVASGNSTTVAHTRTGTWVTPLLGAGVVTRIRVAVRAEHWLAGAKALEARVRVVSGDRTTVVRDVLALTASASTSANATTVYTIDATLASPVAFAAGERLYIELGGYTGVGSTGQGLYIQAGESASPDLPFTQGSTATGRGWVEITTETPADPPTALHQTAATSTTVTAAWTPPTGGGAPTGYQYRLDAGAWVDVGLVTSTTITGLAPGATYALEVRTVAGALTSAAAGPIVVATSDPTPNPPTALHQTGATSTTVTAAWTPPTGGGAPTGYQYRLDGTGLWVDLAMVTSVTIDGLLPGRSYALEVRTIAGSYASAAAGPITVTTGPPPPYRPWLVSETVLALAGLDPVDAQPAFLWQTRGDGWTTHALRSRALIGWQITTGRPGPRDRVGATVATVTLAAWGEYAAAGLPELGHHFRLALSPALTALGIDPADLPRFTGEVTDVSLDTRRRVVTVTAVGRIARKGRRTVDGTSWPVEREGARVARILSAVGASVGALDPGRVELLAPAQTSTAQQLLDVVTDSTTGQLVERRDGACDWHDADHRRDTPVTLSLDAAELLAGFTWAQRVGDLVNVATVRYAAGAEVTVSDDVSVLNRGEYPTGLDTLLTTPAAARAIAGLIVGRYGRPVWLLPDVDLDVTRTLDPADLPAALSLAHGRKVELTSLPAGGPYTDRLAYVEGVVETLTPRAWRLNLTVADEQLAGAPLRWRDVPDGVRWADVLDGVRWLDVATMQDPAELTTP